MAKRPKRQKAIKRLNLSDHTLDINIRKCNYNKFNFSEIEEYVRELVGSRDYQYDSINQIMIYLWGGSYKSITDLGKENFSNFKEKPQIKQRFGTETNFLHNLPLPDRLSGVVHMATGTGKSYVIFAIAYLSLVMGLTKRVLVLGPASTIIEQGLREKFRDLMNRKEFNEKLPTRYRGKAINFLTDNDPIEDDSIVIENINAVYTFGGITDTLFKNTKEVLVLGGEIHHAYSHLKYADNRLVLDKEEGPEGKKSEARDERLWMRFLQKNTKITRHIGFTGTPYNQDEYFADIIYNYSIKDATEERYIKKINSIIRTETDEGDSMLTIDQRFEMVLKNHLENCGKYSYKIQQGVRRVKPITVFICPNQKNAQKRSEEFIKFLAGYEKKHNGAKGSDSEIVDRLRKKVICVISRISESEYKQELDNIEEIDPKKTGGSVEFVFAVNKLSEGWDVDNVFQIVPMEEKVFNSKLLISQVLGRGIRIPREVPNALILQEYPVLTVTNHDKFADHIKELVDSVTESDMYLTSSALTDREQGRGVHNFTLFNLNYIPSTRFEKKDRGLEAKPPGKLTLTPFEEKLGVKVIRTKDEKRYELAKDFHTVDQIAYDIYDRFRLRTFEALHFDFGSVVVDDRYPEENEIRQVIADAMQEAGIEGTRLSEENRKESDMYFNRFLPPGKKKRIFENIEGDVNPVDTSRMDRSGIRVSELERDRTAFLSEDYESEIGETNKFVLDFISELRGIPKDKRQLSLFKPEDFVERKNEIIRTFVKRDTRPPYVVNTSKLKSPQNIVLVSHSPEKEFVFQLIDNSDYIDSWIKSPDKNFYSIDYEYWKGGKDRVRRSFNPDFFIKIDLDDYISRLDSERKEDHLEKLKKLQDEGIETLIKVVEIKSDEEQDEATPAKEEYAKAHFERVNKKLSTLNLADIGSQYRDDAKQYYTFDLLTPGQFSGWISGLKAGKLG
ncbi:MAG: DEAD/DEAH box helicase family protein [Deltaproteobacteria bacterium]|nr:DEAD/DEAH box helicase family protein [Deltaproteobacteria bacterium]